MTVRRGTRTCTRAATPHNMQLWAVPFGHHSTTETSKWNPKTRDPPTTPTAAGPRTTTRSEWQATTRCGTTRARKSRWVASTTLWSRDSAMISTMRILRWTKISLVGTSSHRHRHSNLTVARPLRSSHSMRWLHQRKISRRTRSKSINRSGHATTSSLAPRPKWKWTNSIWSTNKCHKNLRAVINSWPSRRITAMWCCTRSGRWSQSQWSSSIPNSRNYQITSRYLWLNLTRLVNSSCYRIQNRPWRWFQRQSWTKTWASIPTPWSSSLLSTNRHRTSSSNSRRPRPAGIQVVTKCRRACQGRRQRWIHTLIR